MAMTLRLSEEAQRALDMLAREDGVSKQEAASRAILEAAARATGDKRVRELARESSERYRQLLDRLAQ